MFIVSANGDKGNDLVKDIGKRAGSATVGVHSPRQCRWLAVVGPCFSFVGQEG